MSLYRPSALVLLALLVFAATYYEGGYRNEYVGKGIHITYAYLD